MVAPCLDALEERKSLAAGVSGNGRRRESGCSAAAPRRGERLSIRSRHEPSLKHFDVIVCEDQEE